MSEQNVNSFFEKLELNEDLQNKLKDLATKHKAQQNERIAELIAIAASEGFEFSAADLAAVREKASAASSEQDLKQVSKLTQCGGLDLIFWAPCTCGYTTPCNSTGLA